MASVVNRFAVFPAAARVRRIGLRLGIGIVGAGAAAVVGAGAVGAAPLDDLAAGLSNSSADVSVTDLLSGLKEVLPAIIGRSNPGVSRCSSVIQVGDSTSVNVDQATALPSEQDTATAQYRRVGATTTTVDAYVGRAIVDGPGTDAEQAVRARLASGARGCWVIAMGINDAGAIASGSSIGADERIDRIMTQLAGQPVLWPTVTSSNPGNQAFGPAAMLAFNDALRRATARYSNLAVYDWAGTASPSEFADDGIHYTAAGTADRNRRFADALARAYPTGVGAIPVVRWVTG